MLHQEAGCVRPELADAWGHRVHLYALGAGVCPHHLRVVGGHRLHQGHSGPAGGPAGHEGGLRQAGGAVVHAGVGRLHVQELADHGLELEGGLEGALRDLGLVGRVGSQELAPAGDGGHHGRSEVAVDPTAQKEGVLAGVHVAPSQPLHLPLQLQLGEGRRQPQLRVAVLGGDVLEKLVHRPHAHGLEHGSPVVVGIGNVG